MKKLIVLISFFSAFGFSQMTLKKLDGTPINNGDVFTFNSTSDPDNYLGVKVYNSSLVDEMNYKAKIISMTNTNGNDVQLCLGNVCVPSVIQGNSYPPNFPANVDANGENGDFDHFLNMNPGTNPNAIVSYVLKYYQLNSSGQEIGNSVTFTYRYSSNLSNNKFEQNANVNLYPNPSSGILKINTENTVNLSVIDVLGKMVYSNNQADKNTNIDLSNLQKGIYLVKISGENTNTTEKLILQ